MSDIDGTGPGTGGEHAGRVQAAPPTLTDGNIDIQINRELPPEVAQKVEEIKSDIASGKLKIELN